jgi:hypothetical protein
VTDTALRLCERDFVVFLFLGEGTLFGEEATTDLDRVEDLGLVRSWLDCRSALVCESPSPRIAASAARLAPRFGRVEVRSGEILDFRGMCSEVLEREFLKIIMTCSTLLGFFHFDDPNKKSIPSE